MVKLTLTGLSELLACPALSSQYVFFCRAFGFELRYARSGTSSDVPNKTLKEFRT